MLTGCAQEQSGQRPAMAGRALAARGWLRGLTFGQKRTEEAEADEQRNTARLPKPHGTCRAGCRGGSGRRQRRNSAGLHTCQGPGAPHTCSQRTQEHVAEKRNTEPHRCTDIRTGSKKECHMGKRSQNCTGRRIALEFLDVLRSCFCVLTQTLRQ